MAVSLFFAFVALTKAGLLPIVSKSQEEEEGVIKNLIFYLAIARGNTLAASVLMRLFFPDLGVTVTTLVPCCLKPTYVRFYSSPRVLHSLKGADRSLYLYHIPSILRVP